MLSLLTNTIFDIATNNLNKLLTKYNFSSINIAIFNNKIIALNIQNQLFYWKIITNENNICFILLKKISDMQIQPQLIIYIPITLSLLFNTSNNHILSKVKIEGDIHLANKLLKLIQTLNITCEDILALKLPRQLAYILNFYLQKHLTSTKYTFNSLLQSTSDYFTYEKKAIISIAEFTNFEHHNMILRDDVDRSTQKMQKIMKLTVLFNN